MAEKFVKIVKRGGRFCALVPGESARAGRCHSSRAAAGRQVTAINLSKRRRAGLSAPRAPRRRR